MFEINEPLVRKLLVFSLSATLMVCVLRELGSPGCDWLWLCEVTE